MENKTGSSKIARRGNWGYFFLIPFVVVFIIFQFIPLVTTVYNSFFENYRSGLKQVGPNFVGLDNFAALISSGDLFMYFNKQYAGRYERYEASVHRQPRCRRQR